MVHSPHFTDTHADAHTCTRNTTFTLLFYAAYTAYLRVRSSATLASVRICQITTAFARHVATAQRSLTTAKTTTTATIAMRRRA